VVDDPKGIGYLMALFDHEARWVSPNSLILPQRHHDVAGAVQLAALTHHLDELRRRKLEIAIGGTPGRSVSSSISPGKNVGA
jgi:hypothetical protein